MEKKLIDYFIGLVKIDSESKNELATAKKLEADLIALGAEVKYDKANEKTGGNVGNLYAYFPGEIKKEPIMFCSHMDTVKPGNGIKPQLLEDRIVTDGTTILGSDDKSGIAEALWAVKEIKETGEDHAPVELLFTISEEIGLLGAKFLDYSMPKAKIAYALDSHSIGELVVGAPSQYSLEYTINGKESHAGVAPEAGVNAIKIAAEAIAALPIGRIDHETTTNIGIISGGAATNIVPNKVIIEGEIRSHNKEKMEALVKQFNETFQKTVDKYTLGDFQATVEINAEKEYDAFRLSEDNPLIALSQKACEKIGIEHKAVVGGGGSDANVFNANGINAVIVGSGMNKVHTVDEFILLKDLEDGKNWVKEVIRAHSS